MFPTEKGQGGRRARECAWKFIRLYKVPVFVCQPRINNGVGEFGYISVSGTWMCRLWDAGADFFGTEIHSDAGSA